MKTTHINFWIQAALYSTAASLLVSCGPKSGFGDLTVELDQSQGLQSSKFDMNKHSLHKTVCDPWGGQTPGSPEKGILGTLFYQGAGAPRLSSAQDYVSQATKSNQTLFFTDLNVPTRMFHEGFSTQSSQVVKDDSGNKLIEFFGLKFETVLRLKPDQAEGSYELSVLADDGVVVKAKIGDRWETIINNDGDHPTKMGCALSEIHLTRDSAIPLEVTYYQGPRYHIANVLMWRKSMEIGNDVQCNQVGNEHFFDPNNNSVELQPYKDLLARGWEPISADNFFIPGKASYNPCVEGTNPVISGFRTGEIFSNEVRFTWTTDIPATTQILLTNTSTGEQTVTETDNVLRTSHNVNISGLEAGVTYKAQALSVSEDLGKSLSEKITFTTAL